MLLLRGTRVRVVGGYRSCGKSRPVGTDGLADVVLDEVVVDGDGRRRAFAGGGDDLGTWVDRVAGRPDAGDAGLPGGVDDRPAALVGLGTEVGEDVVV